GSANFYIFEDLSDLASSAPGSESEFTDLVRQLSLEVARSQAAAYVALERNRASAQILAAIKDSVSIFVEIRSLDGGIYLQPIQVQRSYSENMFQRYKLVGGRLEPESHLDFSEYARTLERKSNEFLELYSQRRTLEKHLQRKSFELSLVNEITSSLLSTMN